MNRKIVGAIASLAVILTLLPAVPAQAGHGNTTSGLPYGGVNTHITYFGTVYDDPENLAQLMKVLEAKQYRDAVNPDQGQGYYDKFNLAVRRIREVAGSRLIAGTVRSYYTPSQTKQVLDQYAPLIAEGHIIAIEGANEPNGDTSNWVQETRAHQCDLYKQVKARWPNLTVIGPSMSLDSSGLNNSGTPGAQLGDLSHCMDLGNFHFYARHTGIDTRYLARRWEDSGIIAGWQDGSGDPMIATEANGIYGCESPYTGSTAESQRLGMIDLYNLLAKLPYGGAHRVFAYELLDGTVLHQKPACHSENNYGMYRKLADGRWEAKPVFFPVRDANRRG